MASSEHGKLIVISGPSGVGKSTVVRELLNFCELPLELSVSATTRSARPGEIEGTHYYFLTDEAFQEKRRQSAFLECAEVFGIGHWYGTLEQPVMERVQKGRWVILEIDVQGALMVFKRFPSAISIFIHPGSVEELEKRLRRRNTEDEEQLRRRLAVAADELQVAPQYQHIVKNTDIKATAQQICGLLTQSGEQKSCTTH